MSKPTEIKEQELKGALKKAQETVKAEQKAKHKAGKLSALVMLGLTLAGLPFIPKTSAKPAEAPATSAKLPSAKTTTKKVGGTPAVAAKVASKAAAKTSTSSKKTTTKTTVATATKTIVQAKISNPDVKPFTGLNMPFAVASNWSNYSGGSGITYDVGGGKTIRMGVQNGKFVAQKGDTWFVYGWFGNIEAAKNVNYSHWGGRHGGIDFAASYGLPVTAAADGVVVKAGTFIGNCVIIRHADGYETTYGHLSSINVKVGQKVTAGQRIGAVGNSGTTNPHLHFELDRKVGNKYYNVNPKKFLKVDWNKTIIPKNSSANKFTTASPTNPDAQSDFTWNLTAYRSW